MMIVKELIIIINIEVPVINDLEKHYRIVMKYFNSIGISILFDFVTESKGWNIPGYKSPHAVR